MKLLRNGLLVLFLLSVAGLLFANGGQETGPATVTFMVIEADLPKDFVDSFNAENPDINLVRVEENWEKWLVEAMAGQAPDLARLGQGSDVPYFSRRGLLLDMTPYFNKSDMIDMDDIDKKGNGSYQFDGTDFGKGPWYGLSKDYNNIGCITYNKLMFKDAGLPMLSTTKRIAYKDELFDLAQKLTLKDSSGNVTTFGLEFAGNWVNYWASDMAYAADTFFYADETRSKMNRDRKMADIWKYWTRFPVNDISSNVRNPAAGWTGSMFQSDRVAIVQLGYWFGAQLQENEGYEEKYGWAPTPILEPGADVYTNTLGATGVIIYEKSKYPDRAFRVFEWYMAGEYGIHRAKTGWGIPPLLSLREYLPRDNEYNRSRTDIAYEDAKYFVPWMASSLIRNAPVFGAAWNNNIDALVNGEIDEDAFVESYFEYIDEELQVGKEELGM